MAFRDEDLAEHLAEAFGEQVVEMYSLRPQAQSTEAYRSPESKAKQNQRRSARRTAQRETKRLAELLDGTRPSLCDGPGCHNLLTPKPRNGIRFLFCGAECTAARGRRRRDAARGATPAPESRRKYERRLARNRKQA